MITLPKCSSLERLVENADVNGFEISEEDMATLDELDEHLVTDWYVTASIDAILSADWS